MKALYFEEAVGDLVFQGFTTAVSRAQKSFAFCGTAMNSSRPIFLSASVEPVEGEPSDPFVIQRLGKNGEVNVSAVIELSSEHLIFKAKLRDNEEMELRLVIGPQGGACQCTHLHHVA
jgi:hypothetical protein